MQIGSTVANVSYNREWIKNLLYWAKDRYPYFCYLDANNVNYPRGGFPQAFFAGSKTVPLSQAVEFPKAIVGVVSYDKKNEYENLKSKNPAWITCPDEVFFTPELKIEFAGTTATVYHHDSLEIAEEINRYVPPVPKLMAGPPQLFSLTDRELYLRQVMAIQEHIRAGDVYELNYCIAHQGYAPGLDPVDLYFRLSQRSPMPFSGIFYADGKCIISASPERFIKKSGNTLIAQPIKGSVRRGVTTKEDDLLANQLRNSEKERAENLMIVDLMRNDLARIARIGEIQVEELFGVYRFETITQMISTVSCTLRPGVHLAEAFSKTFPMGSMTGAPKIRAMELIDQFENFKRGWFSGCMGFHQENGDFDWNVIIRSIILDNDSGRFYFAVGSAITIDSNPEAEYEECKLKSQAIFDVLLSV